uniref:Uncharacterized protein n=1 Tax=Anopheles culicifacies TaxID=139723 RepID=A0A182M6B8_9DIPT
MNREIAMNRGIVAKNQYRSNHDEISHYNSIMIRQSESIPLQATVPNQTTVDEEETIEDTSRAESRTPKIDVHNIAGLITILTVNIHQLESLLEIGTDLGFKFWLNIILVSVSIVCVELTCEANRSDLTVSMKQSWNGATLTNISVFELPPRLGISRCVSLEFRYGMCSFFCTSASITLLSSLSDRLIFFVSSIRVLVLGLSEPAKSTRFTEPMHVSHFSWCVPISVIFVTACDREERSLPAVAAVARFAFAILITFVIVNSVENQIDCARNNAQALRYTVHRECFAASRLTIRKNANVVSIQSGLYQRRYVVEYVLLRCTGMEHVIEAEVHPLECRPLLELFELLPELSIFPIGNAGTAFFDAIVEIVGFCVGGLVDEVVDAVVTIFGTLAGTALRKLDPVFSGCRLFPAKYDIPLTDDELDEAEDAFAFIAMSQAERLLLRCVRVLLVSVRGFTRSLLAIIATVVVLILPALDAIGAKLDVYFGR